MFLHVIEAKHVNNHHLQLKFSDGSSGEIDLASELNTPIFQPLRDLEYFKSFSLRGHTLCWDNGADFAPEFLKSLMQTQAMITV